MCQGEVGGGVEVAVGDGGRERYLSIEGKNGKMIHLEMKSSSHEEMRE